MLVESLKVCWTLSCVLILILALCAYTPGVPCDIGRFFVNWMLVLTFPIGVAIAGWIVLLAMFQASVGMVFLDLNGESSICCSLTWLVFFLSGYWQWSRLMPWLWGEWRQFH
jgi:hypothetical protein